MGFTQAFFITYSRKYNDDYKGTCNESVEKDLKRWLSKHRYLTREKFIKLGLWKSRRPKRHYEDPRNTDEFVRKITFLALRTLDERARIESLLSTNGGIIGVSWPVASVILHFSFPDKYPIMDFRAIWSLGWEQPKIYNFEFWEKHTNKLNILAGKFTLPLRTIDKALWFYSKEHQG